MGMCFHIPAGGQPPSPPLLLHHILLKYPTPLVVLVDLLVVVNLSIFADFFLCLSVPWESQEQQVVSKSVFKCIQAGMFPADTGASEVPSPEHQL